MIEKVGPVAYRLALPMVLEKIHIVSHVSILRRYRSDPSHVVSSETIELKQDFTYDEEPVEILGREVKELRNKKIPVIKVLWRNHKTDSCHGRVIGINNICFLCSSYCRSQATAV